MHLFENGAIIEVVDDRGRPVPDGERGTRLLLTVLDRYTQPLIRYELSDLVGTSAETCPCGRPYRVLSTVDGREEDILEVPGRDGCAVTVHPNEFHEVLEHAAVEAWQIEHTDSALVVHLVGASTVTAAAVDARLRQRLKILGVEALPIEIRRERCLERGASGKAPLIVSRRARSGASIESQVTTP
jgi:phenylacetate-coenzyme A ligase PaaK-like adenylate-forming protein